VVMEAGAGYGALMRAMSRTATNGERAESPVGLPAKISRDCTVNNRQLISAWGLS
jgi:hypothetical protein